MIAIGFIVYIQLAFMAEFFFSIFFMCSGNFDVSTWPKVFNLRIPLDSTKILGWYFQSILMYSSSSAYILCLTSATTYFVCSCIYICAICDHFSLLMRQMNKCFEQNQLEKNPRKHEMNNHRIKKQIHQAIDVHLKIHE